MREALRESPSSALMGGVTIRGRSTGDPCRVNVVWSTFCIIVFYILIICFLSFIALFLGVLLIKSGIDVWGNIHSTILERRLYCFLLKEIESFLAWNYYFSLKDKDSIFFFLMKFYIFILIHCTLKP